MAETYAIEFAEQFAAAWESCPVSASEVDEHIQSVRVDRDGSGFGG
jgi:hypothetical protein